MKRAATLFGRISFWLTWPALYMHMNGSRRTRVAILCDNHILVVKQWLGRDRWSLVGGGLRKNEEPLQGAMREVAEEVGLQLKPEQLQYLGPLYRRSSGILYRGEYFVVYYKQRPELRLQAHEIRESAWLDLATVTTEQLPHIDELRKLIAGNQV